jgi:CheY-like chemotaxis protein
MKILIIDDDVTIRTFLRRYFSQKHGLTILEAADGLQGLQAIADEFPDLIFLDINMPVMGGIECLEILRSDPVYGNISVLMFTATQDREEVQKLMELGISGFIAKPLDIKDFNLRVAKAIEALNIPKKEAQKDVAKVNPFALRVLIVDGNQRFRSFFCSLFNNRYDVYEANSGMKALQICQDKHPDVICVGDGLSLIKEDLLVRKMRKLDPRKNTVMISCAEWTSTSEDPDSLFTGCVKKTLIPESFIAEVEQCIVKKHLHENRLKLAVRNFVVPNFMELLKQVIDVEEEHFVEDFVMETEGLDLFGTMELYDSRAQSKIKVGIQGAERKLLRMIAQLKEEDQNRRKSRREIIEDLVRSQGEKVALALQTIGLRVEQKPVRLVAIPAGSPPVNWSIGFAVKTKTDEKYIAGFIFD